MTQRSQNDFFLFCMYYATCTVALYAYVLHFYDMIWYGNPMLWYDISLLCYEIYKNDMIWFAILLYGKISFTKEFYLICIFILWLTGLISL